MIAMQSYNGFERLRVQKIRLTFVNHGIRYILGK